MTHIPGTEALVQALNETHGHITSTDINQRNSALDKATPAVTSVLAKGFVQSWLQSQGLKHVPRARKPLGGAAAQQHPSTQVQNLVFGTESGGLLCCFPTHSHLDDVALCIATLMSSYRIGIVKNARLVEACMSAFIQVRLILGSWCPDTRRTRCRLDDCTRKLVAPNTYNEALVANMGENLWPKLHQAQAASVGEHLGPKLCHAQNMDLLVHIYIRFVRHDLGLKDGVSKCFKLSHVDQGRRHDSVSSLIVVPEGIPVDYFEPNIFRQIQQKAPNVAVPKLAFPDADQPFRWFVDEHLERLRVLDHFVATDPNFEVKETSEF